jgi:hypothetical protein
MAVVAAFARIVSEHGPRKRVGASIQEAHRPRSLRHGRVYVAEYVVRPSVMHRVCAIGDGNAGSVHFHIFLASCCNRFATTGSSAPSLSNVAFASATAAGAAGAIGAPDIYVQEHGREW